MKIVWNLFLFASVELRVTNSYIRPKIVALFSVLVMVQPYSLIEDCKKRYEERATLFEDVL